MAKRYLWVVEWKERNGEWIADQDCCYHARRDARDRARWWRVQNPRLSFRVARYSAEDKQMTDHWKDVTTREP